MIPTVDIHTVNGRTTTKNTMSMAISCQFNSLSSRGSSDAVRTTNRKETRMMVMYSLKRRISSILRSPILPITTPITVTASKPDSCSTRCDRA